MRVGCKLGANAYCAYPEDRELAAQRVRNYLESIPPVDLRWSVLQSLVCLGKLEETYLDGLFVGVAEQEFIEQCRKAPGFVHWGFGDENNIYLAIKLQTELFSDSFLLLDLNKTPYNMYYGNDSCDIKAKILCSNSTSTINVTYDQRQNLLYPLSFKSRLEQMLEGKAHLVRWDHGGGSFKIHFEP